MSSEYSTLSDFSWAKRRIGELVIRLIIDILITKEYWESEYPTRTNISDIDTVEEIIPIFGDSFMFCSGMPKQYDVSTLLKQILPEKLYLLNLARCGSGNNRIITRLEQWANDKNSEKTKTIIIGFSSMYRFDYYMI